ncbi:MAG: hypothetical protein JWP63_3945 [Candidatus Solibacter sp.]|nr:hypothetical protein [Candidatus Solibacter sp.]
MMAFRRLLLIGVLLSFTCSAQIAQNSRGLVLTGSAQLSPTSRIEIWLSLTDKIEMPPISWSGDDETDESTGAQWFKDQAIYREKLKALFTRAWRVAPGVKEEVYAQVAFESMTGAQQAAAVKLRPSGLPVAKFSQASYEISIPWEALPPTDRLRIESVRLAVNVIEVDRAPRRPELPSVALNPPIELNFTSCHKALETSAGKPAFALVASSSTAEGAFALENERTCCGYSAAPDIAISPRIAPVENLVQRIGLTEFLCGSPLSYRKGKVVTNASLELAPGSGFEPLEALPASLPSHRLPDGVRLFRDGPLWAARQQTSGECAACPWAHLLIFSLTPSGEIARALDLKERVDDFQYEVEVSPDWQTVTEFKKRDEVWASKSYCLRGNVYEPCGENAHSAAPKHGLLHAPVE